MGKVVQMRDYQPKAGNGSWNTEPATVVVLPGVEVIRIERYDDPPLKKLRRRGLPRSLLGLKQKMELLRILQAAERSRE